MNRAFLATVAAVFLFATAALAQVEQPSQITLQGIGLFTKDTTANSTSTSHSATNSGGFLVGYSYQFNNWAGVEGNYGYSRNTQNYFGSIGQSSIHANMHEFTGSFVAHIPSARIANLRPYVLAGAGALVFDPTDKSQVNGSDRQTRATFVYGGGVNWDLARSFGVRAEYRGLVYKLPDFTVNNLNLDKMTHLAQPSVGFYFRF
jgi:opacity protein-like surface antigen